MLRYLFEGFEVVAIDIDCAKINKKAFVESLFRCGYAENSLT
jgi:hypothetical protein